MHYQNPALFKRHVYSHVPSTSTLEECQLCIPRPPVQVQHLVVVFLQILEKKAEH